MTTTFTITRDGRKIPLKVSYAVDGMEMIEVCAKDKKHKYWFLTGDELDALYEQEKRLEKQGGILI